MKFYLLLLPITAQASSKLEKRAEQCSAIIVHQLDQSGLLHQSAELDELAGSCASVLHPLALVVPVACELETVLLHGQAPDLGCGDLQLMQRCRRILVSSRACRLAERRPVRAPSTS